MKRNLIAPIAIACAMFGATAAQATEVVFSDLAYGSETVDIALSSPNATLVEQGPAGAFVASVNGGPAFVSYCINLYDPLALNKTYSNFVETTTAGHAFANANAAADIGKLFAENNAVIDTKTSAAMQIAIWEIAYETSGTYDLTKGSAMFTGGSAATSGALALATSWLGGLASQTSGATLGVLESTRTAMLAAAQDQIYVTAPAVPEPSTYALLAGGLLCMGFVARRRAAAKR